MHRLEKIGSEFSLTSLRTLFVTIMLQILKGIDTILRVKNAVSKYSVFDFVTKNKIKQSRPRDTAAGKRINTILIFFSTKILGGLDVLRSKNLTRKNQKSENSVFAFDDKTFCSRFRVMPVTRVNDYNY